MELIKQNFSIKDLENLSGIKAHTIRIWEKRYNILSPERTATNIRTYSNSHLQKLLNISLLNEHGYKISRISKMNDQEIIKMVKHINASTSLQNRAVKSFKMAMMNFDQRLFQQTYKELLEEKSFREIFHQVFLPLFEEIGTLWQTDTIKPIHEHYLVDLIKQKLYLEISKTNPHKNPISETLYVLFLPENEIHDIGLLYLYYELLYNNYRAIYLGPSLPLSDMNYLLELHKDVSFLSYFTITPINLKDFIEDFLSQLCEERNYQLHLFGNKARPAKEMGLPTHINIYDSLTDFIKTL